MKSPDREIFIYRYFYQHSIKEIADKLALKAKTVENKLSRGKHRFGDNSCYNVALKLPEISDMA